ncbi:hypothetical protein GCM10027430_19290 [Lysobacter tyrosinilyticus]
MPDTQTQFVACAQGAPLVSAEAATQIGAAAAQHLRNADSTCEGKPRTGAVSQRTDAQHAGRQGRWSTGFDHAAFAIDGFETRQHVCAADRQPDRLIELQRRPLQRELEYGLAWIIADEAIGERRCRWIERAALRHAQMPPTGSSLILDSGQRAR